MQQWQGGELMKSACKPRRWREPRPNVLLCFPNNLGCVCVRSPKIKVRSQRKKTKGGKKILHSHNVINSMHKAVIQCVYMLFSPINSGKQPVNIHSLHDLISGERGRTFNSTSSTTLSPQRAKLIFEDPRLDVTAVTARITWRLLPSIRVPRPRVPVGGAWRTRPSDWKNPPAHLSSLPRPSKTPRHFWILHYCVCFVLVLFCLYSLSSILEALYEFELSSSLLSSSLLWTKMWVNNFFSAVPEGFTVSMRR